MPSTENIEEWILSLEEAQKRSGREGIYRTFNPYFYEHSKQYGYHLIIKQLKYLYLRVNIKVLFKSRGN